MIPLDYNEVDSEFDRRYALYDYPGIRKCLLELVSDHDGMRMLEVGCGIGIWLSLLARNNELLPMSSEKISFMRLDY